MGTKGDLVIVKMLENHSNGWKVNYIHQTFIPGKVLEIDQTAELVTTEGYYEVALEYLEPVEEAEELEIPMFNQGDYVKDKFGNIFKIVAVVAPQQFEQDSDEYDNMGYRLALIDKDPNSPLREVGESSGTFCRQGDTLWIFNTKEDIKAKGYDVLLCDTAGRLQNKDHLMKELEKIVRVIKKEVPEGPHEVLLTIDATTGQNGILQAKTFKEVSDVTGVILTKLDGTAKGGIVIAIKKELGIPVKLVGLGENIDDLEVFDPEQYIYGLFYQENTEQKEEQAEE